MFRNLFGPDTPLMIAMTQITDCMFLSMFWMAGCFPGVTVGASTAALYDAVVRTWRRGEKNSWKRFWKTFRRNWKAGILPTIAFGFAAWMLSKGMILAWNSAVYEQISWTLFASAAFVGMMLVGVLSVLFPMLSRFENTTLGLLKNTVVLAVANLPRTLILGFVNTVCILLCFKYIVPLFFLPALTALISSLLIEPMFKPYMPDDAAE